jgi:anaphase-promoting complex subunit 2
MDNHIAPIVSLDKTAPERRDEIAPTSRLSRHFRRRLQTLFAHSIDSSILHASLALIFRDAGRKLFRLDVEGSVTEQTPQPDPIEDPSTLMKRLKELLVALNMAGLGGDEAQRAFATAVDKLMDDFVESWHMKVDWYRKCSVMPKLRRWVEEGLARYVSEVMSSLGDSASPVLLAGVREQSVKGEEIKQWCDMVVARLGRVRVANLFDYVVRWDASIGAILDLKV